MSKRELVMVVEEGTVALACGWEVRRKSGRSHARKHGRENTTAKWSALTRPRRQAVQRLDGRCLTRPHRKRWHARMRHARMRHARMRARALSHTRTHTHTSTHSLLGVGSGHCSTCVEQRPMGVCLAGKS
jgi:hypothetical protein